VHTHTHTLHTHTHVVYKFVYFKPGKSKESCKEEEENEKLVENVYGGWFISFYNLQGYITCQYAYEPITMHVPQYCSIVVATLYSHGFIMTNFLLGKRQ